MSENIISDCSLGETIGQRGDPPNSSVQMEQAGPFSVKTDDVVARSFAGRALSRQKYVEKAIVTENTAQSKSRKDDVVTVFGIVVSPSVPPSSSLSSSLQMEVTNLR